MSPFRFASSYHPKYVLVRSAFCHRFAAKESQVEDRRLRGRQIQPFDPLEWFDLRELMRRMALLNKTTDTEIVVLVYKHEMLYA